MRQSGVTALTLGRHEASRPHLSYALGKQLLKVIEVTATLRALISVRLSGEETFGGWSSCPRTLADEGLRSVSGSMHSLTTSEAHTMAHQLFADLSFPGWN